MYSGSDPNDDGADGIDGEASDKLGEGEDEEKGGWDADDTVGTEGATEDDDKDEEDDDDGVAEEDDDDDNSGWLDEEEEEEEERGVGEGRIRNNVEMWY